MSKKALRAAKVSDEFKNKSFDDFSLSGKPSVISKALSTAMGYVADFPTIRGERHNSIALLGNPGSGKTHLLMAVANALMDANHPVVYFPWVEGWNEIKGDLDALERKMNQLKQVDVLFIDDLFKGRTAPTDFVLEQTFGLINARYLERKPILVSSERRFDEIIAIDNGLGSRLFEMCRKFTVELYGKNLNHRLRDSD